MTSGTGRNARIVVIGAGHAAGRLIERLIHLGHEGEIVLIGEEAHTPYERPFLSKAMLVDAEEPNPPPLLGVVPAVTHLANRRAVEINLRTMRVILDDGGSEAYDLLVIATGLRPRRFAGFEPHSGRVLCLHGLDEARDLRARLRQGGGLALIGAGFIGLEVASSARALGIEVDIIERLPLPLMRALPAQLGSRIADLHQQEGSRLHLGRSLDALTSAPEGLELTLDSGVVCKAATVVLGMGGTPRVELAEACGIATDDGIVTDATGKSSDPCVYAIGDVARKHGKPRLESWRNAEDSAAAAAAAILGREPPALTGPASFWTDQLGRRIQLLGTPEEGAELWQTGDALDPGHGAFLIRDGQLCQAVFVSAPKIMRAARDCFRRGGALEPAALAALGFHPADTDTAFLEAAG